jgi:hypothetical protein
MEHLRHDAIRYSQRHNGDARGILADWRDVVYGLNKLGLIIEQGPRFAEAQRSERQGYEGIAASHRGAEITTDFSMRGDNPVISTMGQSIMFFNAMIQGGYRLYRAPITDPNLRARTAMKYALIPLYSMANYMINKDDPDFRALPMWSRLGYWHYPQVKFGQGDNRYWLKQPKPWELGAIGSIFEFWLEDMIEGTDFSQKQLGSAIGKAVLDNFGIGLPVVVDTIFEIGANKVYYTGQPIESRKMQGLEPHLRYRGSTPRPLIAASRAMRGTPGEISPAQADAILRGIFGAWFRYAMIALDPAMDRITGVEDPSMFISGNPPLSAFIERQGQHSRYQNDFYELVNETGTVWRSMREAGRLGDEEVQDEYLESPDVFGWKRLQPHIKAVQALRRMKMDVRLDPNLTGDQKRKQIDELEAQINAQAQAGAASALRERESHEGSTP